MKLLKKRCVAAAAAGTLAAAEAKVFLRQYAGMLRHVQDFDRKKRTVSIGSCAPVPISVLVQRITVACPDTSISTEFKKNPPAVIWTGRRYISIDHFTLSPGK